MSQFSPALLEKVKVLATHPQTSVSLKQMVRFGRSPSPITLYQGAQFLKQELPIRLAHRVVELENLPHGLSNMPGVLTVKDWYTQSTQELLEFEKNVNFGIPDKYSITNNGSLQYYHAVKPTSDYVHEMLEYNSEFIKCIDKIKNRHSPTTTAIAKGVLELKQHWKNTNSPLYPGSFNEDGAPVLPLPTAIQSFLDRFYMSRIGIRMLIGQVIRYGKNAVSRKDLPDNYVGIICTKTKLKHVVQDAISNAQMICQNYYSLFEPPAVKIIGLDQIHGEFMYVPSHLHHMLFEILKNSMRAIVERFGEDYDEFPEIRLVVAEGQEDITIKISDEGGGIPRSGMPLIWTYMYTTAQNPLLEENDDRGDFRAPLAGFGYGLPLSRLYARYFGGDLRLISMEGYGTDAYLHLSRLSDTSEPLP
ncbi:mitochondrial branched-chain alpha-ketoacid dehydrogenase kinase-domain-containing protein [Globomyces pollinis-pini]|nr:mitochondrial branched-chain alpha-ketoacid dehydrogenase kinase-domain-containing protein [Globomyces pollinis-pini]